MSWGFHSPVSYLREQPLMLLLCQCSPVGRDIRIFFLITYLFKLDDVDNKVLDRDMPTKFLDLVARFWTTKFVYRDVSHVLIDMFTAVLNGY